MGKRINVEAADFERQFEADLRAFFRFHRITPTRLNLEKACESAVLMNRLSLWIAAGRPSREDDDE